MEIKVKNIDKSYWSRLLEKNIGYISIDEKPGIACLIQIKSVTEPLKKMYFGKEIVLADEGYYWLQLGFENENVWLTSIYDEKGEFVEYYFDITRKNVIDGKKSYFEDMFLDIFVHGNDIRILDEDELKIALDEGVITQSEFDFAELKAKEIIDYILKNRDKCDRICDKYFNILRKKITGES